MESRSGTEKKKAVLVEHRPELARLVRDFLLEEGYEVRLSSADLELRQLVQEFQPDAMVVDLPGAAEGFALLDLLRTDHEMARVPVVVLAGTKDLARRAMASYNVSGSLTKPFVPDQLLTLLRQAVGQPPLHSELPEVRHDGVVGLAEYLLAKRSRELLFRWVQGLREESPWSGRDDLDFAELVDVTPLAVEALVSALHYRSPMSYFKDHPEAGERVSVHGRIRAEQGLPLTSMVREYGMLREEIWAMLWSQLPRTLPTPDIMNLQRIIDTTLDFISQYSLAAYTSTKPPSPADYRGSAIDDLLEKANGEDTGGRAGSDGPSPDRE